MSVKFKKDFKDMLVKIKEGENFAFTRFSDGELHILQNKKIAISNEWCFTYNHQAPEGKRFGGSWGDEEIKSFDPEKDPQLRNHLMKCFLHQQQNYFKGICTKSDVGEENWHWQLETLPDKDERYLTFANLLINGNYINFMTQMFPEFKKRREVVYVCNQMANLDKLPLNIIKDFRIGQNCHINDVHLIEEMKHWIHKEKTQDCLFLFSAASLSNLLIYELYKEFPNNTYMDIGSTLNPMVGLDGWKGSRGYLRGYWLNEPNPYFFDDCEW